MALQKATHSRRPWNFLEPGYPPALLCGSEPLGTDPWQKGLMSEKETFAVLCHWVLRLMKLKEESGKS